MIDGVSVRPLRQIVDERGKIMHVLRSDAPHFTQFGEIYFSCVFPGVIKGWHIHDRMTLNYAVPQGHIKLVLFDERAASPTRGEIQEVCLGVDNYQLVTIPPLVWNSFKGYGADMAMVVNCSDIPHSPDEIRRRDPFDPSIPYEWDVRHG